MRFKVSTGRYSKEVEADSVDAALILAFTRELPERAAFTTQITEWSEKKKKWTNARYIYSVYAYEKVGVTAYEANRKTVIPVARQQLTGGVV